MAVDDGFGEAQCRELGVSITPSDVFIGIKYHYNLVARLQGNCQVRAQFVDEHRPWVDLPALFMKIVQMLLVCRVCVSAVLGGMVNCVHADGDALFPSKLCPTPMA